MEQSLRVLLIEDHVDTQRMMSRILESMRCQVAAAGSCAEARALAASNGFDLVIADLGLPDGNGQTLLHEFRQRYRLPSIALTGHDLDFLPDPNGFDAHLTKPIDFAKLQRAIVHVLRLDKT